MQSPLTTDRSKLRMEKLRQIELEQLQWEQEALVMPEDLNRALLLSFESVKTEFSDLDGLSWSRYPAPLATNSCAVEEPTPRLISTEIEDLTAPDLCDKRAPAHSPTLHHHYPRSPPNPLPYTSSSRVDVAPFGPQDTIRVSRLAQSRSPLQPANQFFPVHSHKDALVLGSGSPYSLPPSHPPASFALACHSLRHSVYRRS